MEQVGKRFLWCQWDSLNQQLLFIHQRKDGNGKKQFMLTCVLFYSNAMYDNVVNKFLFVFVVSLFFNILETILKWRKHSLKENNDKTPCLTCLKQIVLFQKKCTLWVSARSEILFMSLRKLADNFICCMLTDRCSSEFSVVIQIRKVCFALFLRKMFSFTFFINDLTIGYVKNEPEHPSLTVF